MVTKQVRCYYCNEHLDVGEKIVFIAGDWYSDKPFCNANCAAKQIQIYDTVDEEVTQDLVDRIGE